MRRRIDNRFLQGSPRRSTGGVGIVLAVVLALLSIGYHAYQARPDVGIDNWRQYAHDVASDNPENADRQALGDALDRANRTFGVTDYPTNPVSPDSYFEWLSGHMIKDYVSNMSRPTPANGLGASVQTAPCYVLLSPSSVAAGEHVIVQVRVAKAFRGKVVNMLGEAGGESLYLVANDTGYESTWRVPAGYAESSAWIRYQGLDKQGNTACSGNALLTVTQQVATGCVIGNWTYKSNSDCDGDYSGDTFDHVMEFESDGTFHIDFLQGKWVQSGNTVTLDQMPDRKLTKVGTVLSGCNRINGESYYSGKGRVGCWTAYR